VPLRIDIVTLFPEFIASALDHSILKRALASESVAIAAHDLRDWTHDKRRTVDDAPYGGGAGMVLKPEPLFEAVEAIRAESAKVILMTPQGATFDQACAKRLAAFDGQIILLCGHYEGFDERVREYLVDEELSVGDYVLTGGELAALVITDAVVRLLPGVLGNEDSAQNETFEDGLLEFPQYTRPAVYRGWSVPDVLVSGNHGEVAKWRKKQQEIRTKERRPDLLNSED
jgi:tRNA (guanine37-N1)-methyltransferase